MSGFGFGKVGLLPDGIYHFVIAECERKDGKQSGQPYFNLKYEVGEGEFEGKLVWDIASFSEKALWKTQAFLRAVTGDPWDEDIQIEGSVDEWLQELAASITGLTFQGAVSTEEYVDNKGLQKKKNVVTEYYSSDEEVEYTPTEADLEALRNNFATEPSPMMEEEPF